MANFIFNIAKGNVASYVRRVKDNDPATAVLRIVLLASANLEAQSVLEDCDSLSAVVAGATNEATNTGYSRKSLSDSDLSSMTYEPDDTANTYPVDIPDVTWTGVQNDGTGGVGAFLVCYDGGGSGPDTAIIPLTHHTFSVTPDGSDITAQIATGGFYAAS